MNDQEYISHLKSHIRSQDSLLAKQAEQLKIQAGKIEQLEKKVEQLLFMLQKQGVKKNSQNSHHAPSKDLFVAKNKSLREPSTRKTGGQPGHKGHTLEMSSDASITFDLKNDYCTRCGNKLEDVVFSLKSKRQVMDIPSIPPPVYTEYRQYSCTCANCDHKQVADFPAGVNAPIQYGCHIEALVSYFSVFQYMPYARMKSMFSRLFGLALSEGSIQNILQKAATKAQRCYEWIKSELSKSSMVGSDETSVHVNGKKDWIWVWQNTSNTWMLASENRGSSTVNSVWEIGLLDSILVSDRLAAQLKTPSGGNQICLAHLLRDLTYLKETEKHPFAEQFISFLRDIFDFKEKLIERNTSSNEQEASLFENRLIKLLDISIAKQEYPKTLTFQNSMLKCQKFILPCLHHLEVPPDNNASERAIRNIKVKQKVSGQFKSGQHAFCVLRSVIDTCIKRNLDVFNALIQIMNGNFSFQ